MTEDLEPLAQPQPVDEGAVRRKSVMDGMLSGMKRGLLWGGIGGLGLTTLGTVAAVSLGGKLVGGAPGLLGALAAVPVVGKILAFAGIAGAAAGATSLAGEGITGLALGVATQFLGIAVPVVGIALLAGAVVGGTWGAISGYMDSDKKVDQAHKSARSLAAQINFERQQTMHAIMQARETEGMLAAQSKDIYSQNQDIGQLQHNAPMRPAQGQEQGIAGV